MPFWQNCPALMKYLISTTSIMLLLLWPIQAQETTNPSEDHVSVTERFSTTAETKYLNKLALKGFRLDAQGLLIESVDGSTIYADHQSNIAFNPASVIKLATSLLHCKNLDRIINLRRLFMRLEISTKRPTLSKVT